MLRRETAKENPYRQKGFSTLRAVFSTVRRRYEGINVFMADGEASGQDVFHVTLHVLPRYSGDNFGVQFGESYGERPSQEELDAIAKDISGSV
jgi:diadenosine tetraphosphate (Ap4A) HIT family hydrolase